MLIPSGVDEDQRTETPDRIFADAGVACLEDDEVFARDASSLAMAGVDPSTVKEKNIAKANNRIMPCIVAVTACSRQS
ncbi:MAG: hypothetical protein AAF291_05150 [Pseudomonadota bacterium]